MADVAPLDSRRPARVRAAVLRWHADHALPAPWRRSRDPYQVLVAAVMAQQTQMSRVLPAFDAFLVRFPSVESLAAASRGEVIRAWQGLGYNRRAVMLQEAARAVVERHGGRFPADVAALRALPGVGDFTAAIIASVVFDLPAPAVDTNVRRVLARALLGHADPLAAPAPDVREVARRLVPRRAPGRWNQALMDLGGQVCLPLPRCGECPLSRTCGARPSLAGMVRERRRRYGETYGQSRRYLRGRIVDALRAAGSDGLALADVVDGRLTAEEAAGVVDGLVRDGLAERAGDRLCLPE